MRSFRSPHGPLVMGVLNVTPDSFSDGGRFFSREAAVSCGLQLAAEGAELIDVGGESTRPGAEPVSLDEELRRTIPVVERLAVRTRTPISIDTQKAEVARQALESGASIINDVTALRGDPAMAEVAARGKAHVILMHMRGEPRTMQAKPQYKAVVREVKAFLRDAARAAERAGISRERIAVDPGIGFGKTPEHNLALLRGLREIGRLGYPVVVGPSRKSFIGRLTGADVADRLPGTLACVAEAQRQGASVVRVHDVRATALFLRMAAQLDGRKSGK